jgi:hypothetical protein
LEFSPVSQGVFKTVIILAGSFDPLIASSKVMRPPIKLERRMTWQIRW